MILAGDAEHLALPLLAIHVLLLIVVLVIDALLHNAPHDARDLFEQDAVVALDYRQSLLFQLGSTCASLA